MNQRIYLSPPHMSGNEMKYVQESFDSNWIAPMGHNVDRFEAEICRYAGTGYGVALSSGTAAIHLSLRYLNVGPGDTVFCSDLTFIGSCSPILYQHAQPVFIDSEPNTWNMSPDALERAFQWAEQAQRMPKAVIVVDIYGQSADWDRLLPICERYGVPVIEDAAEALGAMYKDRHCGTFGIAGVFSFNGNKIITTSGGGMLVTNESRIAERTKYWATQAREQTKHYEHTDFGYNYRLSNVCAGIGRGQLESLDEKIAQKAAVFNRYNEALRGLPVSFMPVSADGNPNFWLTVMVIDDDCSVTPRDIIEALEHDNIEARNVWKPMHLQPIFGEAPYFAHGNEISVSEHLFDKGVCLPSGSAMSVEDQDRVISIIRSVLGQ